MLGFIGTGVMANAMMKGIIDKGLYKPADILGSDLIEAGRNKAREMNGIQVTGDNVEVARKCDVIFLAVKPQHYAGVIAEIKDHIRDEQIIISIGAGRTISYLNEAFENDTEKKIKIVRVMPNTPAQVGAGMSAYCPNEYVSDEDLKRVHEILSSFGLAERMPENLFDVVTGVSGSGPAYVFMFIEALADAAVDGGMYRKDAYEFAAQTVLGAAKMVIDTGKHPGELKDMVCSPAGTTIAAVRKLEELGLRTAVIEGVSAATQKSKDMQ